MKTIAAGLTALLLTFALAGSSWAAEAVAWQHDLDRAKQLASQTGRLVLVHYWIPGCAPCARLDQNVFSQAEFARSLETEFVPVKVNGSDFPLTAEKYGVDRYPTDVIITPTGQLVFKSGCPQDASQYATRLRQVSAAYRQSVEQYAQAQQAPVQSPVASAAQPAYGAANNGANNNDSRWSSQQPNNRPAAPADSQANNPWAANGASPSTAAQQVARADLPYRQRAAGMNPVQPIESNRPEATIERSPAPQGGISGAENNADPSRGMAYDPSGNRVGATGPNANSPNAQLPYGDPRANAAAPPQANPSQNNPYDQIGSQSPAQTPVQSRQGEVARKFNPPLALDGFCPVSLTASPERMQWVPGDVRFGAVHRGRTYLFASADRQRQFLSDPDRYSPALSGLDPVYWSDRQESVAGRREFGVLVNNRVFLFANEQSLAIFEKNQRLYIERIDRVMGQLANSR